MPLFFPEPDEVPPHPFAGSDVAPPPYLALPLAQYQLCPTGLETIQRGCTVASSHVPSPVQSARLEASSLGLGRFRSHFIGLHPRARGGWAWAHWGRWIKQLPSEASALQLPSLGLPASAPGPRQSPRGVLAGLLSQAISILELQVDIRPVKHLGGIHSPVVGRTWPQVLGEEVSGHPCPTAPALLQPSGRAQPQSVLSALEGPPEPLPAKLL